MAGEMVQLKQLQTGMNAAFDKIFKAAEDGPNNSGVIAAAKGELATMAQVTLGSALGPAFSIIGLSAQVSSRIDKDNLELKAHVSQAYRICGGANCDRSESLRNYQQAHEPR